MAHQLELVKHTPAPQRVLTLSGRAKKTRIKKELKFVCPISPFFGFFFWPDSGFTLHFGPAMLRARALSGSGFIEAGQKDPIKSRLKFVYPNPPIFGLFWPGQPSLFASSAINLSSSLIKQSPSFEQEQKQNF